MPPQLRIADFVELQRPLPAGVKTVTVETQRDGEATFQGFSKIPGMLPRRNLGNAATQQTGAVKVVIGDETAYFAVNLADEAESRIGAVSLGKPADAEISESKQFFGMHPWQALAVLGLVMVCLEWGTYHARWTE